MRPMPVFPADPSQMVDGPKCNLDYRTLIAKPYGKAGRVDMGCVRLALVAALGLAASSATADEKTTFRYDPDGRVTAVAIARSSGASGYVRYGYDDADNRDARGTVTVPVRAASNELRPGETLIPQQSIFSNDGRFELRFQTDGNIALYFGVTMLWSSATANGEGMVFGMQGDGNLVLYSPDLTPQWTSGTSGNPGAFLRVQNDGNVVMRVGSTPIWATNTCCH